MQILVVEDSQIVTMSLQRILSQLGLRAVVAKSCSDALHLSSWTQFEVAIIDLGLPDGSGFELARTLKQRGSVRAIVFHKGSRDAETEWLESLGSVVVKGSPPRVLLQALAKAAGRNSLPPKLPRKGRRRARPSLRCRSGRPIRLSKPPKRR